MLFSATSLVDSVVVDELSLTFLRRRSAVCVSTPLEYDDAMMYVRTPIAAHVECETLPKGFKAECEELRVQMLCLAPVSIAALAVDAKCVQFPRKEYEGR